MGSVNESLNGWKRNYELLWSDDGEESAVWVEREFFALWNTAVPLPEAIRQEVFRLARREEIPLAEARRTPESMPRAALAEAPIYRGGEQLQCIAGHATHQIGVEGGHHHPTTLVRQGLGMAARGLEVFARFDQLGTERARLLEFADRPLKIGSFSAAPNVTGIVSDTHGVSALLHEHGALAFWDFAAAAPYVDIEMTAPVSGDPAAYKDAIFLSPHKFIGGQGTPGLLIAKRHLFANTVPASPGGGTVQYVNPEEHRYLADPEHREEGGTPAIIESIRAGLVFQLKEAVGWQTIRAREEDFIRRAIASWSQ